MKRHRGLYPDEARALRRSSPATRRRVALSAEPEAAVADRSFRWGARPERALVVSAPVPPSKLEELFELVSIDYVAQKGRDSIATYTHTFDPPYPVVCKRASARPRAPTRTSHGVPRPSRGLFALGPLVELRGPNRGDVIHPPQGVYLAATPSPRRLFSRTLSRGLLVVKVSGARARGGDLFIARGASSYSVKPEGIVG